MGGGGPPTDVALVIKGRANFPKLPQQSSTKYATADSVKPTNGRTQSRALSRVADRRADGRTRRRAKRSADQGVAHDIPAIAIITGLALHRRVVGRLWVVGTVRLVMRHYRSLVMVHMLFHMDTTGLLVVAISMMRPSVTLEMIVALMVAISMMVAMVAIVGHCPMAFIHRMAVRPVLVAGLGKGTHSQKKQNA